MHNPKAALIALLLFALGVGTIATDPDHFAMSDFLDIGHPHHEHLAVFLFLLMPLVLFVPSFVPPIPFLYSLLIGAGLVVGIGVLDLIWST